MILVELNKRNRDKGQLMWLCGVETCIEIGFIERTGGMYIQAAKFIDMCSIKSATAPQTTPVDDFARNTTMVKGDRAKACPMLLHSRSSLQQATEYSVDRIMVNIAEQAKKACFKLPIWKDIRNSMAGVAQMDADTGLLQ